MVLLVVFFEIFFKKKEKRVSGPFYGLPFEYVSLVVLPFLFFGVLKGFIFDFIVRLDKLCVFSVWFDLRGVLWANRGMCGFI